MIFNNIDLKKLLDTGYIFEKTPPPISDYLYLLGIFLLFILLSFVFSFLYGRKKKKIPIWGKMQKRIFNLFFTTGIVGLILIFFRWQQIAYLGSRFFMLILWLIFIVWGIAILCYRYLTLSKEIQKYYEKKNFEKYLPTSQADLPQTHED